MCIRDSGRTVHSLIVGMSHFHPTFHFVAPNELRMPDEQKNFCDKHGLKYEEHTDFTEDIINQTDILYMTRVQKERFFNEEDYVRMKDFYILDKKKMELAPQDMIVMHPLPRVNEIAVEVDDDPRAAYFKQAQYAVYARMALILTLLEVKVC